MRVLSCLALRAALVFGLSLVFAGCGGSDNPTEPSGEGGQITALIDGSPFSSDFVTVIQQPGIIAVNGADSEMRAVGFQIPTTGPGTFTLGEGQPVGAGLNIGDAAWSAGGGLGGGSIDVASFSETRITGTFSFTLEVVAGGGTPATRSVTNGQFDVEIP